MVKNPKIWAKLSYESANLIVTFGFLMGALPVKWNKAKNRMEPLTSFHDLARWLFTILVIISLETVIILNFILDWIRAEDQLAFVKKDSFRIIITAVSVMGLLVHIHTAWKFYEFAAFINRAAGFYEFFQNNYAKKTERRGYTVEDKMSGFMKVSFLIGMIICGGLFSVAYLIRCPRHVLFYVVPICNSNYPTYTKIPIKVMGALFQFVFVVVNGAGIGLYLDLFAAVVLMGLYIMRELCQNPGGSRTNRKLFKPKCWFHAYRCMELIVQELNGCIGDVFMPVHMLLIILSTCGAFVILIRYDIGPVIKIILAICLVAIGGYYKLLVGRGSTFCQLSTDALLFMRKAMDTSVLQRTHRACSSLKPNVGGFFPLKQHTVVSMYETTTEMTADLLLL